MDLRDASASKNQKDSNMRWMLVSGSVLGSKRGNEGVNGTEAGEEGGEGGRWKGGRVKGGSGVKAGKGGKGLLKRRNAMQGGKCFFWSNWKGREDTNQCMSRLLALVNHQ